MKHEAPSTWKMLMRFCLMVYIYCNKPSTNSSIHHNPNTLNLAAKQSLKIYSKTDRYTTTLLSQFKCDHNTEHLIRYYTTRSGNKQSTCLKHVNKYTFTVTPQAHTIKACPQHKHMLTKYFTHITSDSSTVSHILGPIVLLNKVSCLLVINSKGNVWH